MAWRPGPFRGVGRLPVRPPGRVRPRRKFPLFLSRLQERSTMTRVSVAVFDALRRALCSDAVDTSEETISRYGRNDLPGGDRRPAGVVYPASTADVQALVRITNEHRVPLYSFSTGENRGMGLRSPIRPGQIIVDVGARMNRILEIDETLCFAAIEP